MQLPDQKQLTENLKTEKPGRNKMPVAEFFQVFLYYKHKDLYNEHVRIKYTMLLYRQ